MYLTAHASYNAGVAKRFTEALCINQRIARTHLLHMHLLHTHLIMQDSPNALPNRFPQTEGLLACTYCTRTYCTRTTMHELDVTASRARASTYIQAYIHTIIHIHTYIHTYHTHIHTLYIHIHIHKHIHTYIHTHIQRQTHIHTYIHT